MTTNITGDYADYPDALVGAMAAAGDAVMLPSFTVALDRLSGSAASVALRPADPTEELKRLQRQLELMLRRCGVPLREGWRFNPHVTLLYRNGKRFGKAIEPIQWQALDFVLVHSWVGRTRHTILKRWPLLPAASATLH
jgi:2'-5' RNA ligase